MAAVLISPANVLASANAKISHGTAGGAITAGAPIYRDAAAANVLKLCQANAQATSDCDGIALNNAFAGQPLDWLPTGYDITIGGTVEVGETYCLSPSISLLSGTMPNGSGGSAITGLSPFDGGLIPSGSLVKLVDISAGVTSWSYTTGVDGESGEIDLLFPIGFSVQADTDTFDIYGGFIVPIGDLTTGDYVTILGIATTTTKIALDIQNGDVAKA